MGRFDYTDMGGSKYNFTTTIWDLVNQGATDQLISLYWKPVYCWLRRRGYNNEDAKDLTQGFFASGLEKEKFERADPARGRFRTFLLKCLANFVSNIERDGKTKGKRPSKHIVSIDNFDTNNIGIELFHTETPEDSFNRAWVHELLLRVLRQFREECNETGKECHYDLFVQRIINPILENTPEPAIKDLAREKELTEKQACNRLITARRAYHRLLRQEIRMYALSDEEVTLEIEDLFKFVSEN